MLGLSPAEMEEKRIRETKYGNIWGDTGIGVDSELQRWFWHKNESPIAYRDPIIILEAVQGVRRSLRSGSTHKVLGLRCEGMEEMEFFFRW